VTVVQQGEERTTRQGGCVGAKNGAHDVKEHAEGDATTAEKISAADNEGRRWQRELARRAGSVVQEP
jgi:hypothetical protein